MKILLTSVLLLLAACSSVSKFQKSETAGYSIVDTDRKDHFQVLLNLPDENYTHFLNGYARRAIGEECAQRGFSYFDIAYSGAKNFDGFCYPTSTTKALAIRFKEHLAVGADVFEIEKLLNKQASQLQENDRVLEVEGKKVKSVAQIKIEAFKLASLKKPAQIKILRAGKELTVTEPIADLANGAQTPEALKQLQSIYE